MIDRESKENSIKTHYMEKVIPLARNAFLECDKKIESSDEYKPILPAGVSVREVKGGAKVCVIELEGKTYTVFGVEKDQQNDINFELLRLEIADAMKLKTQKFSQVIGDSAKFDKEGTFYADEHLKKFISSIENNIILYGCTGHQDGVARSFKFS